MRFFFLKDFLFIALGVISASIGLKGFLLPNDFIDGGAMGVSLLLELFTGVELGILIILVNLPFILIGFKTISKEFGIKSILAILALSILVHCIKLPTFTQDKLLIAVFGGFFLGAGIGLAIRGGAVIDGSEVLAIKISRKSSLTVGDFITIFNVILFGFTALFIGLETSMYAMLTYLSASKTVDFIIHGIEEYVGITIISEHSIDICHEIKNSLGFGVTAYKAAGGFGKTGMKEDDRTVLYCVVTRLETTRILNTVEMIDPNAFIVQHSIKDAIGGMIKRRPFH